MTDRQSQRGLWISIFLLATAVWSVHINRPVDLPNWHEFDYSAIARNFLHEGNNILYPRIDWRGNGPGFTEMEFPIIPWTMAQLYRVFGAHEVIGRLLSLLCMLLSLGFFARLARRLLSEAAALVAALFFVVSHEVVHVATAIQPEALMLLLYLMAVYYFVDWYDCQSRASYVLAIFSFSCAMLVKSPAAHLAIFFLLWALHKDRHAFRRPLLYLFAFLAFTPVVLWYGHAAGLWHQFGNSMGVSNEDHWIGVDILRRPKVILNLLSIDILLICGAGGLVVALFAIWQDRFRSVVNALAVRWLLAIGIYLIVIIRTAGGYWAAYYHVIAVPPVALLFAAGISQIHFDRVRVLLWSGLSALFLIPAFLLAGRRDPIHLPGVFQDLLAAHSSGSLLAVLALLSTVATVACLKKFTGKGTVPGTAAVIVGCFSYFFISGQLLLGSWKAFGTTTAQFNSSACLIPKLTTEELIVASGGICFDVAGHRVAKNAPQEFYWLNRKGFSTCQGDQSVAQLQEFAGRGAHYFVADKTSIEMQRDLGAELKQSFGLVGDCGPALLFDLQNRK